MSDVLSHLDSTATVASHIQVGESKIKQIERLRDIECNNTKSVANNT